LTEAVKHTFDNNFLIGMKDFTPHYWRKDRYYNEKVDNILRAYIPLFDALFNCWTKKDSTRKE